MQTDKQILYAMSEEIKKHQKVMKTKGIELYVGVLDDSSDDEDGTIQSEHLAIPSTFQSKMN